MAIRRGYAEWVIEPDDEPTHVVEPTSSGRRSRRAAIGLIVGLLALGAGAAVSQLAGSKPATRPPTAVAPSAPTSALRATPDLDEQRATALQTLLEVRARAVLDHDERAWLSTLDPQSGDFTAKQAAVFANLRDVPFSAFTYQFDGVATPLSTSRREQLGQSAWVARVIAEHRLAGFDRTSAQTEQYLTVVRREDKWFLAADTDGETVPEPWDLGRVRVVRGDGVLVMGTADLAELKNFAAAGERAVGRVSEVWGEKWPRRAVLVVPRTEAEMGRLLLRGEGLDQVAAVTSGELSGGGSGEAGSDRVVVNPKAFLRLGVSGRRVVLTHELTHVAVRSSTSAPVPTWLSEGFADYVGYQDVRLSTRTVAADVLALVRQGEGFTGLPTAEDFDPTLTTIAPAYSAAWLACSLIADRYGTPKLVQLYRTVAASEGEDPDTALTQAFGSVLGISEAEFTKAWLGHLSALAAP